jgi:hypothetical protein
MMEETKFEGKSIENGGRRRKWRRKKRRNTRN